MSIIKKLIPFVFLFSSCISTSNHSGELTFAIDNKIIDSLNCKFSIIEGKAEAQTEYYLLNLNSLRGGTTSFLGQTITEANGNSYDGRIQLSNNQGVSIKFSYDKLNKLGFSLGPDSLKIYDISPFFTKN